MKSPTSSILHSIQALKSKLRNDHLELQGLRRDFAMGPIKSIIQTQERSQSPIFNEYKANHSLEKHARNKLLQLRKNHQNELKKVMEQHNQQKEELIEKYETKIQQITTLLEDKVKQQDEYILMLEEQIAKQKNTNEEQLKAQKSIQRKQLRNTLCSNVYEANMVELTFEQKIQLKMFQNTEPGMEKKMNNETSDTKIQSNLNLQSQYETKYEKIVNTLLKENASLLEQLQRLKMENRKLKYANELGSSSKNTVDNKESENRYNSGANRKEIFKRKQNNERQYCSVMPVLIESANQQSYRNSLQGKKNRLKFSKVCEDRNRTFTDRSYTSIGSQNVDTSNIMYRDAKSIEQEEKQFSMQGSVIQEEEEQSILSQDIKLKTIKHFKNMISNRSSEAQIQNDTYLIPKPPMRKGNGIRNALRNVTAL